MNRKKLMYIVAGVIVFVLFTRIFSSGENSSSQSNYDNSQATEQSYDSQLGRNPQNKLSGNYTSPGAKQNALKHQLKKAYENANARIDDRFEPAHLMDAVKDYPKYPIRKVFYLTDGDNIHAFAVYEDNLDGREYDPDNESEALPEFQVAISSEKHVQKMLDFLDSKGVVITNINLKNMRPQPQQAQSSGGSGFTGFLIWILIFYLFWRFIIKPKMNGGQGGGDGGGGSTNPFNHNNSKAIFEKPTETFKDVAGCEDAKKDAEEILKFMKNPTLYRTLQAKMPKTVLLSGPSGTGKTLLAKAIAGEAIKSGIKLNFLTISGSQFVEMFVGTGASRMQKLFAQAAKNKPCVIFIDEIDAVGGKRGKNSSGGDSEREQTLNQLLVDMTKVAKDESIIIIAATNRPNDLDPALVSRFKRRITMDLPNLAARAAILKVHIGKKPIDSETSIDQIALVIADKTPGFSGRNIEDLVDEAASFAADDGRKAYTLQDFEKAAAKLMASLSTFTESKATMQHSVSETFADVAGCEEAKEEVTEVVDFLKNPEKYQTLGGKMPTGVLLSGPPGTGKTLLAKAMAGEANVPFFTMAGSEFVEQFVGKGAARVRELFAEAKKHAPCIIFIDEIDAVGGKRGGGGTGGGNEEREQTLNQLLVEMDGFKDSHEPVIVIAATNRPDMLDPALLRPGRFDRQATLGTPDLKGREQILRVHMAKIKITQKETDRIAPILARGTPGFSGADIANLVNEAAVSAARDGLKKVDLSCFDKAKDKVMMGAERKSMIMSDLEKEMTAFHEAGHAIVGERLRKNGHDPVYKVSVMPRNRALGVTMFLPEQDRLSHSKKLLSAMISGLYGGRLAEEIIYGKDNVSTGASNDIERATGIATGMATEWGFTVDDNEDAPRLYTSQGPMGKQFDASPEMQMKIDARIQEILNHSRDVALEILQGDMEILHVMTKALLKYETIGESMIAEIMAGTTFENLSKPTGWTREDEAAWKRKLKQQQAKAKEQDKNPS